MLLRGVGFNVLLDCVVEAALSAASYIDVTE
jgi:hypothetical protein